jgi:hypothetical protein
MLCCSLVFKAEHYGLQLTLPAPAVQLHLMLLERQPGIELQTQIDVMRTHLV